MKKKKKSYLNCLNNCRVMPDVFSKLCAFFRQRCMLQDSRHVTVEEQLRIFLQTIGLEYRNRSVQHNLQHLEETIIRYFNTVLDAVCA